MVRCNAITGTICARHDHAGHPECNARLIAACTGIPPDVTVVPPPGPASLEMLEQVHDPYYLRWLMSRCAAAMSVGYLDTDTYITPHSFDVASCAAGAAVMAAEKALSGEHCFSLMRPPGHHAERDRAMGFCLLNNTAIAASQALHSVDRIAIVDWDVHHGNGIQHCFYRSDRVLYCSVHQEHIFPYSGEIDETGAGNGQGFTINVPLPAGSTSADYYHVFSEVFVPALERFRPDLLIVSAGQDILFDDLLGTMMVEPAAFERFTDLLLQSVDTPIALILEGGYGVSHGAAIGYIFRALTHPSAFVMPKGQNPQPGTVALTSRIKTIHRLS